MKPVQVLNRYNALVQVSVAELQSILSNHDVVDVHHINAAIELWDDSLSPIVDEGLRSVDPLVLRSVAAAAVQLKLVRCANQLRDVAQVCPDSLVRNQCLAASIYLVTPDRGLGVFQQNTALQAQLASNCLLIRNFDAGDIKFLLGAMRHLVNNQPLDSGADATLLWVESMMPNVINALARSFSNGFDLLKAHPSLLLELRQDIDNLKSSPLLDDCVGCDPDIEDELNLIDDALDCTLQ